MRQFIFDEFDIILCSATIHAYLKEAKWSRKVVRRRAQQRSDELRAAFRGRSTMWSAHQLVFLDETASNERTGDRKFGWSPIGKESEVFSTLKRSERWSILPALDVDGYFACHIFQGSINKERFIDFLSEVLKHCEPYPGKRSIIIMDNASIHHDDAVLRLCDDAGVLVEYLPPYSPDMNPIEHTFHDLKAWIRRHHMDMAMFSAFDDFLWMAVSYNCERNMRNHFRHCGYIVE